MAQQEHIDIILQQGVKAWNTWRKQRLDIRADLSDANLSDADLSGADLIHANLIRADLSGAYLSGADLSGAYLIRADLIRADLRNAKLRNAKLRNADLSGADLSGADLSGADLSGAYLIRADLRDADLIRADLSGADLIRADLIRADLSGANLTNTKVRLTTFGELDLRNVKGLETVEHEGPSNLSLNTIFLSEGHIPEGFLRGTGAPDSFIEYMHSLVNQPIQYYTCFISYSSKDAEFVERLYTDLQSKNVRCWLDKEDLKIGDKFRNSIDEAIRFHDKLLLVLSEHSVESAWVEKEVETAFDKEHKHKKLVLFPVKLDETVMQTDEAWAADIRRMRHIGDFTHWKDHDFYQKTLVRLLRDLKAERI